VASFTDLARAVAANWKTVDEETKDYCLTIARILKERHAELSEAEATGCLSKINSISPGLKVDSKQRSANSNQMSYSELSESVVPCCLPTMDFVSAEPANEMKRRELQRRIPRRASKGVRDQKKNQYPVAHEQGTMNGHDNTMTCATRMYEQYLACAMRMCQPNQLDHMFTDSSTTMMWDNCNLDFSIDQMPHPNLSGFTQLGIQGTQMSTLEGSYGGNEPEFPIITNVSQRAMISNMMSAIHTSKQPIFHHEGKHRRWSAPECLETPKQEEFHAMYEAQELDIPDSDVVGMWHSSTIREEN
jgi:hypothetical protein